MLRMIIVFYSFSVTKLRKILEKGEPNPRRKVTQSSIIIENKGTMSGRGRGNRGGGRVLRNPPPRRTPSTKVYCVRCGADNVRSHNHCGVCGLGLWPTEVCKGCLQVEPAGANWSYCLRCGKERDPILPLPQENGQPHE